jgi:hypothetical protein
MATNMPVSDLSEKDLLAAYESVRGKLSYLEPEERVKVWPEVWALRHELVRRCLLAAGPFR